MNDRYTAIRHTGAATVIDGAAHRVLRNTYLLLSLCLGFAAVTAGAAATLGLPYPGILLTLLGYFGMALVLIVGIRLLEARTRFGAARGGLPA